jgi:DNA polymerase-1
MKLLLIDGSNLIFRAYYATEKQNILTPAGVDANAIHTLIGMINKMVTEHKPTHMFIGLDTGSSTFRHKMYEDYKGKRSATPDRLKVQFSLARELYDAMGVRYDATDEYEADDLIATYAKIAKEKGFEVQIVSGDKDLLQLVDKNVKVLTPAMGFDKEVNYDEQVFYDKYDFNPERFIEYKALVGDSSDNIIGVEKLGDKTARKLINEYDDIEAMIDAAKVGIIKNKL